MTNNKDPFYSAGPVGSWGRGDAEPSKPGPTYASNSWWNSEPGEFRAKNEAGVGDRLLDRFGAAMDTGPDTHLARLVARINKLLKW